MKPISALQDEKEPERLVEFLELLIDTCVCQNDDESRRSRRRAIIDDLPASIIMNIMKNFVVDFHCGGERWRLSRGGPPDLLFMICGLRWTMGDTTGRGVVSALAAMSGEGQSSIAREILAHIGQGVVEYFLGLKGEVADMWALAPKGRNA